MDKVRLYQSEFEDANFKYALIKGRSHNDFADLIQEYVQKDYEIMWETFHITPVGESYIVILQKAKPIIVIKCNYDSRGGSWLNCPVCNLNISVSIPEVRAKHKIECPKCQWILDYKENFVEIRSVI